MKMSTIISLKPKDLNGWKDRLTMRLVEHYAQHRLIPRLRSEEGLDIVILSTVAWFSVPGSIGFNCLRIPLYSTLVFLGKPDAILLSACITTYNRRKTLIQIVLESILRQRFPKNYEVIVVDDASDTTLRIELLSVVSYLMQEYPNRHIRLYIT